MRQARTILPRGWAHAVPGKVLHSPAVAPVHSSWGARSQVGEGIEPEVLRVDGRCNRLRPRRVAVHPADGARPDRPARLSVAGSEEAAEIGEVRTEPPGMVLVETAFGGRRVMDLLAGDPLPRIC